MKYLIVNADDFGLAKSVNDGVRKAYREGILTSVSVIPSGEAYGDAAESVTGLGLREIGAHLSLTETVPLTEPDRIPTLVGRDRWFHRSRNEYFARFFLGRIDIGHVYIELKRQLDELKKIGLPITNLSSHEHIHMIPAMLGIFITLAKEYGIPAIRYPHNDTPVKKFSPEKLYRGLVLAAFRNSMKSALDNASLAYPDHFGGFMDSGKMDEARFLEMLENLRDGTTELVTHPGFLGPMVLNRYRFHLNCERELHGLTSPRVKRVIKEKGITLISYHEFLSKIVAYP